MAHKPNTLTQGRLQELLHYDPETGVFTWKATAKRRGAGAVAGSVYSDGYRAIQIDGKRHKAHRLAFLFMSGLFPEKQVDHINNNRDDNRWSNLREASPSENQRNKSMNATSATGYKGAQVSRNKFRSRIVVHGRKINLGSFETEIEAAKAYDQAARQYFGEFAKGNFI